MSLRGGALAIFLLLAPAAAAGPIPDDLGARVAETFAAPTLARFDEAAIAMRRLAAGLCERADAVSLAAARAGFARLATAWGRASVLRFGPLTAENRLERVFFWPDPRGVIVRQVQALLADADEAALAPGGLAGKSVALQGLPALEFVLFGTGAEELEHPGASYRCRYGMAVADNVAGLASDIAAGWAASPFRASFAAPASSSDPYRSRAEVAGELVKALATGLQFARNAELLPALGGTPADARGRRAPLWRSGLTFALVQARLEGLSALLDATGFGEADDAAAVVAGLKFELRHMAEALAAVATPAEHAFADPADRERIRYVAVVLGAANATVGERLSGALGLTMGFNALDGD